MTAPEMNVSFGRADLAMSCESLELEHIPARTGEISQRDVSNRVRMEAWE